MKKNKEAKKKKKQINYNDLNSFERCEEKRNEGGERGWKIMEAKRSKRE